MAAWWDLPSQTEVFGGKVSVEGSMSTPRFYGGGGGDLLGIHVEQWSEYTLKRINKDLLEIGVLVKKIQLFSAETGVEAYRFYRLGDQTIYEGFGLYGYHPGAFAGLHRWLVDMMALKAAKGHAEAYKKGRRPSAQALKQFQEAVSAVGTTD